MPAMHFQIRWPDASETRCYSPSLVVQDFLVPGEDYALDDFLHRVREALAIASDRVRLKFGFACSRASDQLAEIEALAAPFADDPAARVAVLAFSA
jgi:uncharacterized repeat protein (TIGR04042 family)